MTSTPLPAPATQPVSWTTTQRQFAFEQWLAPLIAVHGLLPRTLRAASSDASFRRYLRLDKEAGGCFIIMDAPPPLEDVRPFVSRANEMQRAGLLGPRVLAQDEEQGFLLLNDLGQCLLLDQLQRHSSQNLYKDNLSLMRSAIDTLVAWQIGMASDAWPAYDETLFRRELALFPQWCVQKEHGVTWTSDEQSQWDSACDLLVQSALAQPTVAVHRDFMPRNLMVTPQGLAVLDFQDAVRGPITYDIASLIRDAFFSWDEEQEIDIAVRYWEAARKARLPVDPDFGEFWQRLEWMGLQRHLKVLGIFCRLKHRDGKPKYSEDLPRFFAYAHKAADRYNSLRPLARLLEPLMGTSRVEAFY
jgi:aminoglycoside/choline kinase family phosphotransferase